MIQTIRSYIEKHQLLVDDRLVLVGLSGGADSVALLSILVRLSYPCVALHVNFHLRGEEADQDEAFARQFATSLGVSFYKKDFDTEAYAKERKISIEMAARDLRYTWFEDMRIRLHGQAIAVAHHQDDNVETVLMNLVRGTGIRGLRGIRPKNGWIVRPLLCVSREKILNWLADQHYTYRTDQTNLSDVPTRNFIRLRIVPLLEKINPSTREAIARTAEHLSDVEKLYKYVVEQAHKEVFNSNGDLSIEALMRFPAPNTLLYEVLKEYGFSRSVCEEIFTALSKESGKNFYSSTHRLVKDRNFLLIAPLKEKEERTFTLDPTIQTCHEPIKLSYHVESLTTDFQIKKDKHIAYFDYDKLQLPLSLRTWKDGDWFIPFGMKGRKKLSDYFSDHKFSLPMKERTWLLCSGTSIIWIVGERTDDRYRIHKSTKRVLIVNFLG